MEDLYFSASLPNGHTLCLAPLTDRKIQMASVEISDPGGYFLYEKQGTDDLGHIEIIAQVFSDDAALRLRDMFQLS